MSEQKMLKTAGFMAIATLLAKIIQYASCLYLLLMRHLRSLLMYARGTGCEIYTYVNSHLSFRFLSVLKPWNVR